MARTTPAQKPLGLNRIIFLSGTVDEAEAGRGHRMPQLYQFRNETPSQAPPTNGAKMKEVSSMDASLLRSGGRMDPRF